MRAKGTDENEKDKTDKGVCVCVVADEKEPSEEGQPMSQTSL